MPRIQGLAESGLLSGNATVKALPGYVFSLTLTLSGGNPGDKCYLRDGTDNTAAIEETFVFATANATITKEWAQGKQFDTGIFWDRGTGVNVTASMTYK